MFKRFLAALILFVTLLPLPSQAARLFTCGFEEDPVGNLPVTTMWTANNGNAPQVVTTSPHSGLNRFDTSATSGNSYTQRNLSASDTAGTYHIRMYLQTSTATPSADTTFFTDVSSGPVVTMTVQERTTGVLRLTASNNGSPVNFDTTAALQASAWYRVELEHVLLDAGGSMTLKLYDAGGTLQDTVTTGSIDALDTNLNGFRFGKQTATTVVFSFDDIAINDETGSLQTSYAGAGNIALVHPASDTTITWTSGAGGSATFANVDDVPGSPDDATTLNCDTVTCSAALDTNEDKLGIAAIGTGTGFPAANATMTLIDLYSRVNVATAVSGTMALVMWDEASTRTQGPTMTVSSTTWREVSTAEHEVLTLAGKSLANVNAFSIGYKALTGTVAKQVTALWGEVEWTPALGGCGALLLMGAGC